MIAAAIESCDGGDMNGISFLRIALYKEAEKCVLYQ